MFTYWLARFRYVVLFLSGKENTQYMFSKTLLQLLTEPSKKEHNDQFHILNWHEDGTTIV